MSKDIIYFAENVCGLKLPKWQKEMLLQLYEICKKGGYSVINVYRHQGKQLLQNILINYELWSKDQRIAELEERLKKFIEPQKVKFNKFNGYRGTRFRCPNCNKQIENCIDCTADYYCKHCGQRVVYPKFRVVNNVGELYFEEEG